MAILGDWNARRHFQTVDDLLNELNVDPTVWSTFEAQVGNPGTDLRLLAALLEP